MRRIGIFSGGLIVKRQGNLLDTLCAALESKMQYGPNERDMVMLQHRFEVELSTGEKQVRTSTLLAFGEPGGNTSMATTVGVPCGIATQLILDGIIKERGVFGPLSPAINDPIIEALEKEGIKMIDEIL